MYKPTEIVESAFNQLCVSEGWENLSFYMYLKKAEVC